MLYFRTTWCYMYSSITDLSMKKDYQRCLDKLASTPPETKSALIRSLLPGIEAALNSGKRLKAIWEALREEGLQMSYHSFHKTVSRSRKVKKPTATSSWEKQPKPSEAQALRETEVEKVGERDPLANRCLSLRFLCGRRGDLC